MSRKLHQHENLTIDIDKAKINFEQITFEQWNQLTKKERKLYNHICILRGVPIHIRNKIT